MKKNWKPLDFDIQFGLKSHQPNWSQVEDTPADLNEIRSSLPTETNATRKTVELSNISEDGPFILNFSNIPYDSTDEDLRNFLSQCEISRIIRNDRRKGCGVIEFSDFKSLNAALLFDDKYFKTRPIRLSVATTDDIDRMSGGNNRRNDYKQGYSAAGSGGGGSADDDDWRAKKPTPKPQTQPATNDQLESNSFRRRGPASTSGPKEASPSDSSNWRQRATQPTSTEKPLQENIDEIANWRRAPPSNNQQSHSKSQNRPHHQELTFGRKPPPSNIAKDESGDKNVEEKFERMKITHSEVTPKSETSSFSRANAWGNKKVTKPIYDQKENTEANSDALEWRTGVKPIQTTQPVVEEKKKPEPAPVPSVNVWEERKKSKMTSSSKIMSCETAVNSTDSSTQQPTKKFPDHNNSAASINKHDSVSKTVPETAESYTSSNSTDNCTSHVSATVNTTSKPPVVISAKGPYLDPTSQKTHQMQQYVTDNTHKLPKVVPITKSVNSDVNYPTGQSSTMPLPKDSKYSATSLSKTNPKSSWAKGPPKNLVEKSESNQNVMIQ